MFEENQMKQQKELTDKFAAFLIKNKGNPDKGGSG